VEAASSRREEGDLPSPEGKFSEKQEKASKNNSCSFYSERRFVKFANVFVK
jgi:hypothetical protein